MSIRGIIAIGLLDSPSEMLTLGLDAGAEVANADPRGFTRIYTRVANVLNITTAVHLKSRTTTMITSDTVGSQWPEQ